MKTAKSKSKASDDLKLEEKIVDVGEKSKTIKKKPKSKKQKLTKDAEKNAAAHEAKLSAKTLSVTDLAKIEKKKAKKQAQKAKKQQKKLSTNTEKKPNEKDNSKTDVQPKKEGNSPAEKSDQKQKEKKSKKGNNKDPEAVKRDRDPAAEAATIFVGNLPINTKRVQIVRLLQPYGTVQSIRLRTAGGKQLFKHKQRKGAGSLNAYVVLENPETAVKALALNGTEFKENHLRVTPAVLGKGENGSDGTNQAPSDADVKRTVFVGNLKYSANEEKLREIFSTCGEIDYIRCLQEGEKGCKGVAYVCFQKPDAVGLALELNETNLDDRPIHVERYSVKKLGAKKARDSSAAVAGAQSKAAKKPKVNGAQKRIDKRQRKDNVKAQQTGKGGVTKKKSEYRGVKVDAIKKNKKPKKKTNSQMNALAKKIAPKATK